MELEHIRFFEVRKQIKKCEEKHIQQVVYSSYHDILTQICFTCNKVRTSLKSPECFNKGNQDGI